MTTWGGLRSERVPGEFADHGIKGCPRVVGDAFVVELGYLAITFARSVPLIV